jgi:hypothetical protein
MIGAGRHDNFHHTSMDQSFNLSSMAGNHNHRTFDKCTKE